METLLDLSACQPNESVCQYSRWPSALTVLSAPCGAAMAHERRRRPPRANRLNNATVSHPARRQTGKFLSSLENGRIVRFVV